MADRPIIFSAPMVRALVDGRKTQTRRVLIPPAPFDPSDDITVELATGSIAPKWQRGDRLWVREAHALLPRTAYRGSIGTGTIDQREHPTDGYTAAVFREGFDRSGRPLWRPSIHMPRWASRLTLAVTEVRVERLQNISRDDAAAEGLIKLPATGRYVVEKGDQYLGAAHSDPRVIFQGLWNSINGPEAWDANPWVAAISFTVHRANIDALDIGAAA